MKNCRNNKIAKFVGAVELVETEKIVQIRNIANIVRAVEILQI